MKKAKQAPSKLLVVDKSHTQRIGLNRPRDIRFRPNLHSVIRTKLMIPNIHADMLLRPQLVKQLKMGLNRKLTVVSAPAGFGKSTLICQWLRNVEAKAAWVSLDADDDDLVRFLVYLVTALQSVCPSVGQGTLEMLSHPSEASGKAAVTMLINDLVLMFDNRVYGESADIVVVLDDFHLIQSPEVHDCFNYILTHLPLNLHFVLVSRSQPLLPLARYRAGNQLLEINDGDLRFSKEEVKVFFKNIISLNLSAENISLLDDQIEGWIAGMQMAAISLKGCNDVDSFISRFSGSDNFISDYMMEEVMGSLSLPLQEFLMKTSVLNHLHESLCDAVCRADEELFEDSKIYLDILKRSNIFIIELDGKHLWFRYHHLFSDFLMQRFSDFYPEQVSVVHQRASLWYETNGMSESAIDHALYDSDWVRAAYLLDRIASDLLAGSGEISQLVRWFKLIPKHHVLERPRLAYLYAFVLYEGASDQHDKIESIAARLANYSRKGAPKFDNEKSEKFSSSHLLGFSQILRGSVAQRQGDFDSAFDYALAAESNLPYIDRHGAYYVLGMAYFYRGFLQNCLSKMKQFLDQYQHKPVNNIVLNAYSVMLDVLLMQGKHKQIKSLFLEGVTRANHLQLPGLGFLYVNYAAALYDLNRLNEAESYLLDGIILCSPFSIYSHVTLKGHVLLTKIHRAHGLAVNDLIDQMGLIPEELAEKAVPCPFARFNAELTTMLCQENRGDLLAGVEVAGPPPSDKKYQFVYEEDYLALVRFRLWEKDYPGATQLLDRIVINSECEGRLRTLLFTQLLRVQILATQNQQKDAKKLFADTLKSARKMGLCRLILDEGVLSKHLFMPMLRQGVDISWLESALPSEGTIAPVRKPEDSSESCQLVESLSNREIEVLRVLSAGLSNREVAARLNIAVETVKNHLKNIYGKLQVNSRTKAIYRAKALALIE